LTPLAIIKRMALSAPALAHHYHQRLGQFVSEERFGDWRLKLYGLPAPERGVRPELLEVTREHAQESLPPVDDDRHGAAFAIAHDARFPIALIYWWQGLNEIHQRIFAGPDGGDATELREVTGQPMGCVWELGIVEFERRAWIEDVIGNPDGPDLERYMSRRFDGLI
jgi:hypothetical protein